MNKLNIVLSNLKDRQDIVFATFFIVIVAMLVVPLPTYLIDIFLTVNIAVSLLVLLSAVYLKTTLELSTFPLIILITTLFRLALTVSTTRLILSNGDAGHIVQSFGEFVVAGNVIVGLVIFLIVAIVQFLVITKGAERTAEVGARFTLDALPGKQAAVDADLRAGELTKEEAKARRFQLEKESQFFGNMDGAMKFVKGDAITSLVVVFINLIGGILIGVAQRGMPFKQAGHLFSLLSIGDGLVAQIPAMFIAVAAGVVVTRVALEDSMNVGVDISRQLGAEPKALGLTATALLLMAVVPGFPTLTFMTLGILAGSLAVFLFVSRRKAAEDILLTGQLEDQALGISAASLFQVEAADPFRVTGSQTVLDRLASDGFMNELNTIRDKDKELEGFDFGRIGFEAVTSGPANSRHLTFYVDGIAVSSIDLGDSETDWKDKAVRFVSGERRRHFGTVLSVSDTDAWLKSLAPRLGALVTEVEKLPIMGVTQALAALMRESVPLGSPRIVLNAMLKMAGQKINPDDVVDHIRYELRRQIFDRLLNSDDTVAVIAVQPKFEDDLRQAVSSTEPRFGVKTKVLSAELQSAFARLPELLKKIETTSERSAVLIAHDLRRTLLRELESRSIQWPVISPEEMPSNVKIRIVGTLDLMEKPEMD